MLLITNFTRLCGLEYNLFLLVLLLDKTEISYKVKRVLSFELIDSLLQVFQAGSSVSAQNFFICLNIIVVSPLYFAVILVNL